MFTSIVGRFFRIAVLFFAAYAFVFVPLGEKTALEHVLAVFRTPEARQAGTELKTGAERLVKRLRESSRAEEEEGEVAPAAPHRAPPTPHPVRTLTRELQKVQNVELPQMPGSDSPSADSPSADSPGRTPAKAASAKAQPAKAERTTPVHVLSKP